MSGRSSQRKGRAAELELVRILQDQGIPAEPGNPVSFGETPDITGIRGIHAEVKRRENVNLSAALKQAAADAEKFGDGLPAVFHRRNRESWRVTMALEDWLALYAAADRKNQENVGKEVSNDGTAKTGLGGAVGRSEQGGSGGGSGCHRQDRTKLFE